MSNPRARLMQYWNEVNIFPGLTNETLSDCLKMVLWQGYMTQTFMSTLPLPSFFSSPGKHNDIIPFDGSP